MDIHGSCLSGVGCGPARCVCFARLWCLLAAYELPLNRLLLTDFTSTCISVTLTKKQLLIASSQYYWKWITTNQLHYSANEWHWTVIIDDPMYQLWWMVLICCSSYECHLSDHSCNPNGGLLQGWESECCGVMRFSYKIQNQLQFFKFIIYLRMGNNFKRVNSCNWK